MDYILNGHQPVLEPDPVKFMEWMDANKAKERMVKQTIVGTFGQKPVALVSTIFLGTDHNFSGAGEPILFETMVFQGEDFSDPSNYQERYSTWEEAEAGHKIAEAWAVKQIDEITALAE